MQCKDIPTQPILEFIHKAAFPCGWHDLRPRSKYCPTVRDAMPEGITDNLVLAKMQQLIKSGLVDGCCCGCRGDFTLTTEGEKRILPHSTT